MDVVGLDAQSGGSGQRDEPRDSPTDANEPSPSTSRAGYAWRRNNRSTRQNADSQQRNLPAKGFRPGILLLGMGAVMGYGWYKLIHGMREAKYVAPL